MTWAQAVDRGTSNKSLKPTPARASREGRARLTSVVFNKPLERTPEASLAGAAQRRIR